MRGTQFFVVVVAAAAAAAAIVVVGTAVTAAATAFSNNITRSLYYTGAANCISFLNLPTYFQCEKNFCSAVVCFFPSIAYHKTTHRQNVGK